VTLFALLIFAFQGYLVQTHIHGTPAPQHQVHASSPARPAPVDPYDPASCPLCQEIIHAGAFVTPVVAGLPFQLDWIAFAAITLLPDPVTARRSLNWQSRAPPRR
jgi:hypothetical protein